MKRIVPADRGTGPVVGAAEAQAFAAKALAKLTEGDGCPECSDTLSNDGNGEVRCLSCGWPS